MPTVEPRPTLVHHAAPVPPGPITAERYVSREWADLEERELWPNSWLFACLERDVAEAGQFQVFEIGRESIIISCPEPGELRAMYNVCQHRGARVATESSGRVEKFVCPYHGWSYRPDGRLVVVPDNQRFTGGVDRETCSMPQIRVDTFAGLVFVCMDADAPPLVEFLGEVGDRIAPYAIDTMSLVADQTVRLDCNWKAVFDNFGELYHVEHIHPQHELMFDCPTAQIELFDRGHTGVLIDGHTVNTRLPIPDEPTLYLAMSLRKFGADPDDYHGRVLDIRDDMQKLRRDAGPSLGFDYDALTDERLSDIEQYNLFPNTVVTVIPDDTLIMRARPDPADPNRCYWDKLTFRRQPDPAVAERAGVPFEPADTDVVEPIARPDHDEFEHDDVLNGEKSMTITIDQDVELIRDIQAGMHSRGFDRAVLSEEEARIQHYHDWLDHALGVRTS